MLIYVIELTKHPLKLRSALIKLRIFRHERWEEEKVWRTPASFQRASQIQSTLHRHPRALSGLLVYPIEGGDFAFKLKMGGNGVQEALIRNNYPTDGSYHNMIVSSGTPHQSSTSYFYACCCGIFVRRYKERSKRIDVVSRLVIFFNLVLAAYLIESN